jgi:hypothetical protein
MPSRYLAHRPGELKTKLENPGGNTVKRLRLDMGCNTAASASAAAYFMAGVA